MTESGVPKSTRRAQTPPKATFKGLCIYKRGRRNIASEIQENILTNLQKGYYMAAVKAVNQKITIAPVPENIRQLVSLITSVIRRINEKQLDISANKCLYISNSKRRSQ